MKNSQIVKVQAKTIYDIEINGTKFKGFEKTNEWEGFCQFKDQKGERIIACQKEDDSILGINPFFQSMLGVPSMKDGTVKEFVMIKASPNIIEAFTGKPDQKSTTTESGET